MHVRTVVCVAVCLLGPALQAGVVVETELRVPDSEVVLGREVFYAQGKMTRTDPAASREGQEMSVIFRDGTMWFVDHEKRTSQKIDKETIDELSEQLDEMMKQFEQIPAEQRAMMEKMMKGKMAGMEPPPPRRVEVGALTRVGDFACTVHTLYEDEKKVKEVCSADEAVAGDLAEAMDAFRALSEFTEELQKIARRSPIGGMVDTPYQQIFEIEGFPVRVRWFDDGGKVTKESTLQSIARKEIDPEVFSVPADYKTKDLRKEL